MLRLIALVVLLHAVAAQSPSPNPLVQVNGGGTMNQVSRDLTPCGQPCFRTSVHHLRVQAVRRCHMWPSTAQNTGELRGMVDSQMGGDPRAVNARLRLTSGTQLGGTAMLGTTTPTAQTLGGTANTGTTPSLVPSTQTQAVGTVTLGPPGAASAVGESGICPLLTSGTRAHPVRMQSCC